MHTFIEAQNPESRLLFRRNNDCVLGRKVIGLHLGAWEEVRCTVYLLCLSILIWEGGKCHFTLYALINRAFPPSAISQFCLRAYPIPARPMMLQLHIPFINKRFSFQNLCLNILFVSLQFLALGTHFGKVFLLDIQGNVIQNFEVVSMLKFLSIPLINMPVSYISENLSLVLAFRTWILHFVQSSLEEKLKVTERWNKYPVKIKWGQRGLWLLDFIISQCFIQFDSKTAFSVHSPLYQWVLNINLLVKVDLAHIYLHFYINVLALPRQADWFTLHPHEPTGCYQSLLERNEAGFPWIEETAEFLPTDFGDIDLSWKEIGESIYLCKGDF